MNEVADSSGVPQKGWMRERERVRLGVSKRVRESLVYLEGTCSETELRQTYLETGIKITPYLPT